MYLVLGTPATAFGPVGFGLALSSANALCNRCWAVASAVVEASKFTVGGGTIVGKLVSITTRSGNRSTELIRITGRSASLPIGSGAECGKHQADSDQQQGESAADEPEVPHQRHRPPPFGDDLEAWIVRRPLKID